MGSSTKTISYRYDAVGNRVGMTGPDGGRFTYSYDSLRRMTRVINPQGERTSYSYDDVGRRTLMKLANGTRTSYTYDPANRLTTLGNLRSDGTVISQFDYKYDNVGNRTAVKEQDGSRVTYTYDNLYQLTGEHRTGSTPYRNTYTYDSRGNRTLKNESNVRTTYVYDACNQLRYSEAVGGRTTYTFDNDGNQTKVLEPTGARTTTTWDYENKATLTQLPSGLRNTMSYDTEGMRIKLEDSSGVKKYVWDQQNYLAETDAANDTQVVYTNEPQGYGNLISQRRNNGGVWTPSYYHYEALGSTRQLTNSSQTITDTYLYDAWGNLITSTGSTVNPFRYVGKLGYYYDPDTTNYYIRARIYRPVIARWLSVDPLGVFENLHLYLVWRLTTSVDPSGKQSITPTGSVGLCENVYDSCDSTPATEWTPGLCLCDCCKCEETLDGTEKAMSSQIRKLFSLMRKQIGIEATSCLEGFTTRERPFSCVKDRPEMALTCPRGTADQPRAFVCIPENFYSICEVRRIILHELIHVKQICAKDPRVYAKDPRAIYDLEYEAYKKQCEDKQDTFCRLDHGMQDPGRAIQVEDCITTLIPKSIGQGNATDFQKACKDLTK